MAPALDTILLVTAHVVALAVGAWLYLRHLRMDRPPMGVFHLRDIVVVTMVIIAIPPVYLRLPDLLVGSLFALVALVILQVTLAPAVGGRVALVAALVLVAADVVLAVRGAGDGERDPVFFALNNVLVVVLALGVANLWVQAGLRARDVAIFAGLLTIYDVVATAWLPTMVEFFFRVAQLPFAPAVAWGDGTGMVGVGVGDLFVLALWVVVAEKAYGGRAALAAGTSAVLAVVTLFLSFYAGVVTEPTPAMVLLGPVVLVGYLVLRRIYGAERTVGDYYASRGAPRVADGAAVPSRQVADGAAVPPRQVAAARVMDAVPLLPDRAGGPRRYVAVDGREVVAEAATVGEAVRRARASRPGIVPTLMWTTPVVGGGGGRSGDGKAGDTP